MDVSIKAGNPSGNDLRFLYLFPNLNELRINYEGRGIMHDEEDTDDSYLPEEVSLSLEGIEHCPMLEALSLDNINSPVKMNGIEFCQNLEIFYIASTIFADNTSMYAVQEPMDISHISQLTNLQTIGIESEIPVRTDHLDLSACTSLKYVHLNPTGKNLEFIKGIEVEHLILACGNLQSLKGLNTSHLISLDARNNDIRSIKILGDAKELHRINLLDNPITDREDALRILNSLPSMKDMSI